MKRSSRSFVLDPSEHKPARLLEHVPLARDLDETKRLGGWVQFMVEPFLSECVHGWRPKHGVETAIARIRELGGPHVAGLDVVRFFPSIDQRHLEKVLWQLPHNVGYQIFRRVEEWLPDEGGLPEGNAISPPLANLYLGDKVVDGRWPASLTRVGDNIVLNVFEPERELRRLHGRLADIGLLSHHEEIDCVHFCNTYTINTQGKGGGLHIFRTRRNQAAAHSRAS
jgi:hypothetical protein